MSLDLSDLGYAMVGASEQATMMPFTDLELARFDRMADYLNDVVALNPYAMEREDLVRYGNRGLRILTRLLRRYEPDLDASTLAAEGRRIMAPFENSMFDSPEDLTRALCEGIFLRMGALPSELESLLVKTMTTVDAKVASAQVTREEQRQCS